MTNKVPIWEKIWLGENLGFRLKKKDFIPGNGEEFDEIVTALPKHTKSKCNTFILFESSPLQGFASRFQNTSSCQCLVPNSLPTRIHFIFIGYLTVPSVLGFHLYLSGCSFSSLYCPLHVSAPLCGCLCAGKIDPANGLTNNPEGGQAVSHIRKDNWNPWVNIRTKLI